MNKDLELPDGTYGAISPSDSDTMTLWWVHRGKMKTWPPKQRWAPYPPQAPQHLTYAERRAWRNSWYGMTYWPWKQAVIDAIAADLEAAAARFDEHVPADERPVIPVPGRKPKPDKVRADEIQAAFMHDHRGMSVDAVADEMKIPRTTAWRRIQNGRLLLTKVSDAIERISGKSALSIAADHFSSAPDRDGAR
ncbi:hypothetical protein [Streptosporangium sp. NPDC006930]|uniref:hypothetical protein n=1 Tax=Streptosporangium sp. NPDC006930 TaxID=3154783 RepID=UPI00342877C8